jgi:NTE family protein
MNLDRPTVALALGGGGALGAFHGGVYQGLIELGLAPDWVAGTSIGAFNAAIIAGNSPDDAGARLRTFWEGMAESQPTLQFGGEGRRWQNFMAGLRTRFLGRPGLFQISTPKLLLEAMSIGGSGLYDFAPVVPTLERLIDFERIAQGPTRLTVTATDLLTGEPVLFDSRGVRIGVEHLLASASLIPDFGPREVDGRLFCDGGFSANLPLNAFDAPPAEPLVCVAAEVMGFDGPPRQTRAALTERANDILFSNQSRNGIAALRARYEDAARRSDSAPAMTLAVLTYQGRNEGTDQKLFDFSQASVGERWAEGYRQAIILGQALGDAPEPAPGSFTVQRIA